MVPLVPVITASQVSVMVIEQVQTASLFPENFRTKTAVPSTPGQKRVRAFIVRVGIKVFMNIPENISCHLLKIFAW